MTRFPRFGLEVVRAALRRRVTSTSLRHVAAEIPMSFSGLRSFLRGGMPQAATRAKLVTWYVRFRDRREGWVSREDVDAAITLLSVYVREPAGTAYRTQRLQSLIQRLSISVMAKN